MKDDSGSIVLGWLTKLAASLAFLGLIAFDGIALVTAHFNGADHASIAASLAADSYKSTRDVQGAYDTAVTAVLKDNETIEAPTFQVAADGRVTLRLHRQATTLWMHRIPPLRKFIDIAVTGTGSPLP